MTMETRLARAEKRVIPSNPLDALSDDELELAICASRQKLEAAMGMPEREIVKHFERELATGTHSRADAELMRGFIRGVASEAEMERTLGRPIGAVS